MIRQRPTPEDHRWWVKIADFGISKILETTSIGLLTRAGTPNFMAPELFDPSLQEQPPNYLATDMWALGAVALYLLTCSFDKHGNYVHSDRTTGLVTVLRHHSVSMDGGDFILSLLQRHPKVRPFAIHACNHSWVQAGNGKPVPSEAMPGVDKQSGGSQNDPTQDHVDHTSYDGLTTKESGQDSFQNQLGSDMGSEEKDKPSTPVDDIFDTPPVFKSEKADPLVTTPNSDKPAKRSHQDPPSSHSVPERDRPALPPRPSTALPGNTTFQPEWNPSRHVCCPFEGCVYGEGKSMAHACAQADTLIKHLATRHIRDSSARTPADERRVVLPWAVADGHERIVELILETKTGKKIISKDAGKELLLQAAMKGHTAIVDMLLKRRVAVEFKNRNGQTPLTSAAKNGHTEVVKLLLKCGARTDVKLSDGKTALHLAAEGDHATVVKLLLNKRADTESKTRQDRTALSLSAEKGQTAIVDLLLNSGADVDAHDAGKQTSLSWAAREGHQKVVTLLLESGATLDLTDTSGRTPLLWALEQGHCEVVELLLEKGAVFDHSDRDEMTPLFLAAKGGHTKVVGLILDKMTDARPKRDQSMDEALLWAISYSRVETVGFLLTKGVEVNKRHSYGWSPLSCAAETGNIEVVKLLLEKGADIKGPRQGWLAPKKYAQKKEIYDLLGGTYWSSKIYERNMANILKRRSASQFHGGRLSGRRGRPISIL